MQLCCLICVQSKSMFLKFRRNLIESLIFHLSPKVCLDFFFFKFVMAKFMWETFNRSIDI